MAEKKTPDQAGAPKPPDKSKQAEENEPGYPIRPHPLAEKLQPPDQGHAQLVTLTGYPGQSPIEGKFRLYLDEHFQSYYEIENQHLVHDWNSITGDDHSPRHVAVRAEARPQLVVNTSVSCAAAAFVNGHMVSAFLSQAIETASSPRGPVNTPPPPPPPHGVVPGPVDFRSRKRRPSDLPE